MTQTLEMTPPAEVVAKPKRSRLKTAFLVLGGLLAVFAVTVSALASRRPDTFAVERSLVINAPADKVFPLINDFREWPAWSPFEKLDPAMKKTYEGPETGTGSVYYWDGNSEAGTGRVEITESIPSSKVAMTLDFTRPVKCHNIVEFTLEPQPEGTKVTWHMHGQSDFPHKILQVLLDMDHMIGSQFHEGLTTLGALAEK